MYAVIYRQLFPEINARICYMQTFLSVYLNVTIEFHFVYEIKRIYAVPFSMCNCVFA